MPICSCVYLLLAFVVVLADVTTRLYTPLMRGGVIALPNACAYNSTAVGHTKWSLYCETEQSVWVNVGVTERGKREEGRGEKRHDHGHDG